MARISRHRGRRSETRFFWEKSHLLPKCKTKLEKDKELSEIPRSQRRKAPRPIDDYVKQSSSRNEAIRLAYTSGYYSMKEVGDHFGLQYSRVRRIINEAKVKTCPLFSWAYPALKTDRPAIFDIGKRQTRKHKSAAENIITPVLLSNMTIEIYEIDFDLEAQGL